MRETGFGKVCSAFMHDQIVSMMILVSYKSMMS
jgi:hypothetical protein